MNGYKEVARQEWPAVLSALERTKKRIVLLSHSKIQNFKNPMGEDFQRYSCDLENTVYDETARWADAVLFGNYLTLVKKDGQKAKGIGGTERRLYTERRDSYNAKNRYGMPEEIDFSEVKPEEMYNAIFSYIENI